MYYKDDAEAVHSRNSNRNRKSSSFTFQMNGDAAGLLNVKEKLNRVRCIAEKKSNIDLMNMVLDNFLSNNETTAAMSQCTGRCAVEHLDQCDDAMFVATKSAIDTLLKVHAQHAGLCGHGLQVTESVMHGHTCSFNLTCVEGHSFQWDTSPALGEHQFLVNHRILHGFVMSGMRAAQYERFAEATGFGKMTQKDIKCMLSKYQEAVENEVKESKQTAVLEEMASYEDLDGINILTDARHSTRKNAKFTDVVCIGAETHKVLDVKVVTREEERCAQKHELLGTKKIYHTLEHEIPDPVHVNIHCHDRNLSINKWLREEKTDTQNNNDTWHAAKSVKKQLQAVCTGAVYREGKTWHSQLADKAASVKTHVYWSMRNCDHDAETLTSSILNIPNHYKGDHEKCHSTSRCRTDRNYVPTKVVLTDPKAEQLLVQALRKTVIYKNPTDYIFAMDTFMVESFNNALLSHHCKRSDSTLSTANYIMRTNIAVLEWNANINTRRVNSLSRVQDCRTPRRMALKRNLGKKVHPYWSAVWKQYVSKHIK